MKVDENDDDVDADEEVFIDSSSDSIDNIIDDNNIDLLNSNEISKKSLNSEEILENNDDKKDDNINDDNNMNDEETEINKDKKVE